MIKSKKTGAVGGGVRGRGGGAGGVGGWAWDAPDLGYAIASCSGT